jgi:replicative DNA helicase
MADTTFFDYPIDQDNEALIASNIILDSVNREYFVKLGNWQCFRNDQYKTIAWSVIEAYNSKMEVNLDAILLKSKGSPVKFLVTFEFLTSLTTNFLAVPEVNFREHYSKLIVDSVKAKIIDKNKALIEVCSNPKTDLGDIQDRLNYFDSIVESGHSGSKLDFMSVAELMPQYMMNKDKSKDKYTTGFSTLDEICAEGYAPKQVSIITALSGMGKSSFALSSMKNLANKGVVSAQFALEMNTIPLIHKLLAFNSQLSLSKIIGKVDDLTPEELAFYNAEVKRLEKNYHIFFNDKPSPSLKVVREQLMLLQDLLKTEYLVCFIDLFGKIKEFQSSDNFARDYEKNCNIVQNIAKELGIHMSLVAQIRRDVANRKDSRPTMQDLKNAGALTEIADLIFGIHRPFYNPKVAVKTNVRESLMDQGSLNFDDDAAAGMIVQDDINKNIAEVLFLKQRMGENNHLVNFVFDPNTTCFCQILDKEEQKRINARKTDLMED